MMIPVAYAFILWGGLAFFVFVSGLAIASLLEFYNMCSAGSAPVRWWGVLMGLMLLLNAFFVVGGNGFSFYGTDFTPAILTVMILGLFVIQLLKKDLKYSLVNSSITLTGVFYVVWMAMHCVYLREIKPYGLHLVIVAVICTWCADAGAYFAGLKFGIYRKLHIVSPNKSRAGALGAVTASTLSMFLLKYIMKLYFINIYNALALGVLVGFFAVIGDLAESLIKRTLGHKDSGIFLPGHGGVLDRIDSLLFTVPLVYYYVKIGILR